MIVTNKPVRGWRPADGSEPPKPWRERLQEMRTAYGNIPGAFRLVWGADKRSTIVMAMLTLISAFLPLAQAWAAGLILNSVTHSFQLKLTPQAGLQAVLPYLALEFALLLTSAIITQLRRLAEHVLNARLGHHINSAVIRKALSLDLQYFEDASFYDKLQNARREAD
ncbi:MAG TPA: ABC transporter ATP-binding protein, partial [Roseiflexaceae bacterium]|nr:ABC transporter ATP-binding protein [Roseiflexaceae bacterium]